MKILKKSGIFAAIVILAMGGCIGCQKDSTKVESGGQTEKPAEMSGNENASNEEKEDAEADAAANEDSGEATDQMEQTWSYQPPAEIIEIDKTAANPSNESIKFVYDEQGRISQCYYKLDGAEIYLSYTYEADKVQIYGFSGEILAAEETFDLPGAYDSSIGFTEHEGYFFKGYEF